VLPPTSKEAGFQCILKADSLFRGNIKIGNNYWARVVCKVTLSFPAAGLSRPFGDPADFLDFRDYKFKKVASITHKPSLPQGFSWYSFLEAESTQGHMVPSVTLKKFSSDTTGVRFRDPPTSNAVP
jgi:hypothetical protein